MTGDTPEGNPLDTSLFHDLVQILADNVAATENLPETDPDKFSMSTPDRIDSGIRRIWGSLCPPSYRILHDVGKIPESWARIVDASGCIVEGLGNRKGVRQVPKLKAAHKRGGHRIKGSGRKTIVYLHETAKNNQERNIETSKITWLQKAEQYQRTEI